MDLEGEIDRLYGLDRDAFVAERDAAAKRLRREGDREGAERLRALRKPTVAAWAVNRLARDRPQDVGNLLSSVDELGLDAAQRILEEADSASAATVERVRETLHAVSVDPQARELLRTGRLDRERQPGGLDALGLAGAVPVEETPAQTRRAAGEGAARIESRPRKRVARGAAGPREAAGADRVRQAAVAAREEAQRRRAASREARDAVRAAERRAESARRHLDRVQAADAKADAAREEARIALAEAQRERDAAIRQELALRDDG